MTRFLPAAPALLALALLSSPGAEAAESYDNCSGFIDSVPATISKQGVWCLRADLSTGLMSGAAITVATNNVTVDCNDFKLGGLAAGVSTATFGIVSSTRLNTTIRNCNIRGFLVGALLPNGGGHVIEGNRFEANTVGAILASSSTSTIRGNLVVDTGGTTFESLAIVAIEGGPQSAIMDNTITGVSPTLTNTHAIGIRVENVQQTFIVGNRISGLVRTGSGGNIGIQASGGGTSVIRDNNIIGNGDVANSLAILCNGPAGAAFGNVITGFASSILQCATSGNFFNPL